MTLRLRLKHVMNKPKPSFLRAFLSVLAAALGVQSKTNLEKDFQQSSPLPFILAGLVFTVIFVLTLVLVVKVVLKYAA